MLQGSSLRFSVHLRAAKITFDKKSSEESPERILQYLGSQCINKSVQLVDWVDGKATCRDRVSESHYLERETRDVTTNGRRSVREFWSVGPRAGIANVDRSHKVVQCLQSPCFYSV